jgi:hypothetical protein
MSIQTIHLRKLLLLFDASPRERRRVLLADISAGIRSDERKKAGEKNEGGDFYSGFWSDAKRHAAGEIDLRLATADRIARNFRRKRLYPVLANSFLQWWDEKRRWRNEPFETIPQNVKAKFQVTELASTIKVESLLAVQVGGQFDRIIYPYFCITPTLSASSTKIGLWVLSNSLVEFSREDVRILDVFRSASFGVGDLSFEGNEREKLVTEYSAILEEWNKLKRSK